MVAETTVHFPPKCENIRIDREELGASLNEKHNNEWWSDVLHRLCVDQANRLWKSAFLASLEAAQPKRAPQGKGHQA